MSFNIQETENITYIDGSDDESYFEDESSYDIAQIEGKSSLNCNIIS